MESRRHLRLYRSLGQAFATRTHGPHYIYRNEVLGAAFRMGVELDGKPLGYTAANTYLYTEVTPGKHTVTPKAENTHSIDLDAIAGKLYYLWQEIKMGVFSPRSKLHLASEADGRKGVLERNSLWPNSPGIRLSC